MYQKRLVIFAAILALSAPSAEAGLWIQTSASATQANEVSGTSEVTDVRVLTSSAVGFSFLQGFVLGVRGLTSRNSLSGDHSFALGPKGGLLLKGIEFTAAYLPWARRFRSGDTYDGAGFAINLGYTFRVVNHVRLGFMGTYWSATFSHLNREEQVIRPRSSYLSPMLSLAVEF